MKRRQMSARPAYPVEPTGLGRKQVRVQKLSDQVTRLLAARILDRVDDPSFELLSEAEICEEFGVSRTVAREVVGQLEGIRLVTVQHGRRTRPRRREEWDYLDPLLFELEDAQGTRRLLTELTDVRLVIEPEVAAWAAQAASPEICERLGEAVAGMRRNRANHDRYLDHDIAFHAILVEATDNRVLARIMESLRALLYTSRQVLSLLPESADRAIEDHDAIWRAVLAANPDGARQAMREHLGWAMRTYGIAGVAR
jgi:DNA-binding FadR family transcriptional regulator